MSAPEQLFSQDAEEALIARVLMAPEEYESVDIDPEDFYVGRHREIWQAIGRLHAQGARVDFITLTDDLDKTGKLAIVGGAAELARLVGLFPYQHEAIESAAIVRENASRRAMLMLASDLAKLAHDRKTPLEDKTGELIDRLARLAHAKTGAVHWSRFYHELLDEVDRRMANPDDVWGIQTGMLKFDKVTGGLQPGELMVLSGEPGIGKSMWAMQMAVQMAKTCPGAIYSIEMGGIQVARRSASAEARVPSSLLKSGRLTAEQYQALLKAVETLAGLPVYMSDASNWTTSGLRADLARLKAAHGVRWFVLDYMLLLSDAPQMDEPERAALISRSLKLMCRSLDIAGVGIHSMTKTGFGTDKPGMADLRGTAQVAFDADLICFLTSFKPTTPADKALSKAEQANLRTLSFAKGRELEIPESHFHMVKLPGFPAFGDYVPEPNAQRVSR